MHLSPISLTLLRLCPSYLNLVLVPVAVVVVVVVVVVGLLLLLGSRWVWIGLHVRVDSILLIYMMLRWELLKSVLLWL